jgi:hypothetical protein
VRRFRLNPRSNSDRKMLICGQKDKIRLDRDFPECLTACVDPHNQKRCRTKNKTTGSSAKQRRHWRSRETSAILCRNDPIGSDGCEHGLVGEGGKAVLKGGSGRLDSLTCKDNCRF